MAIRKVLLPLISTGAGEAALSTAWTIAQLRNAHMVALHVQMDPAPDRLCAKCAFDMDLAGGDIGQVRFRSSVYLLQRSDTALRQSFGGQRQMWPLRQHVAQFGVDKFDRAHGSRIRLGQAKR